LYQLAQPRQQAQPARYLVVCSPQRGGRRSVAGIDPTSPASFAAVAPVMVLNLGLM